MPEKNTEEQILMKDSIPASFHRTPVFSWKNENGDIVYHNCLTGKQSTDLKSVADNPFRIFDVPYHTHSVLTGVCVQETVSSTGEPLIVLSKVELPHPVDIQEGTKIHPIILDRIFIRKDRSCWKLSLTKQKNKETSPNSSLCLTRCHFDQHRFMLRSESCIKFDEESDTKMQYLREVFGRFFAPIVPANGIKVLHWTKPEDIQYFLTQKNPVKKIAARQKLIDALMKEDLPILSPPKDIRYDQNGLGCFAELIRIRTGQVILRTAYCRNDSDYIMESCRILIGATAEECIASRQTANHEFVCFQLKSTKIQEWKIQMKPFYEGIAYGTVISYFLAEMLSLPANLQTAALISFITFPVTEQLYKNGFHNCIKKVLVSHAGFSLPDNLKYAFGVLNLKSSSVLKSLGVNSYQLKKLRRTADIRCACVLDEVNHVFCADNNILYCIKDIVYHLQKHSKSPEMTEFVSVSNLDNQTFDCLFSFFETLNRQYPMYLSDGRIIHENIRIRTSVLKCMRYIAEIWGLTAVCRMTAHIPCLISAKDEGRSILFVYEDTLMMISSLDQERIKLYRPDFFYPEDVVVMHQYVLNDFLKIPYDISLFIDPKQFDSEQWELRRASWKKYRFSDDDLEIVIPVKPEDLIEEGFSLHHCVGTYIANVCSGEIDIVFIRKKSKRKQPFFTVAIRNENHIEQIHGRKNKNVDKEPMLIPFLEKWMQKKHLTIDDRMKW